MGKFKDAIVEVTPKLTWELPNGGEMCTRGEAVALHAESKFSEWYEEQEKRPTFTAEEMMAWLQFNADDVREFLDLTTCNPN